MAKLFLDSTDDAVVSITGNNFTVFGFAGKTISVAAGVTGLNLKSSVEAVKFSGNVSDYTFLQTGTNVVVKNAAGAVVSTVAVQSDADGSSLAFANGTYAVKTVAPATAGALSTITFGGATINNADAATNNTSAAAPSTAAAVAGTAVVNALPVLTVPTTAASAIIGQSNAVSGISFTDADDNTGFTVKLQATGTSQIAFSAIATVDSSSNAIAPMVKDASGNLLAAHQGASTIVLSGTRVAVNTQLANLTYISNASIAGSESLAVTVTDAKGGSASNTVSVAVAKQLALSTTTVTASITGTANDDQFTGSLADFSRYTSPYSVVGAGGNDKLILSSVNGDVAGLASGISALELTLTGNSTLTVSTSKFASSLTTVNATGNYTLGGTFNSGTTFNIAALASAATNGLTITNLLVPSTSVASAVTTDAVTVNLTTTTAGDTTLASITDTARTIDVLNINSNGSVANVIGTINPLATNATVNIAGAKDLTITTALPALGTGKVDASTFTGKLKLTTDAASTTVLGGSAADSITGGAGTDSITGNAGNDSIVGSNGSDTLSGGAGDDTLTGGTDIDSILGGDGADSITSNNGNDFLYGEAGNDTINGGTGSDSIDGGADADSITGGGGSDTLVGGAGNDTIVGEAGVDAINGGTGADVLTGGITGVNTYTFTLGDSGNTSATRDSITDLKTGDIIKFGGYGISGLTTGANLSTSASSLTAKEVYVDQVNNRIVIETAVDGTTTEEIVIPSSVGKAAFTYNYGADSVVGTADDYLTVGYAPLTKANDGLGTLTLVGNTIANVTVNISTNGSPTVGGDPVTGGIVRTLNGSAVTGGGMIVTGSDNADTITLSAQADTVYGGTGADTFVVNGTSYVASDVFAGGTNGSSADTPAIDTISVTADTDFTTNTAGSSAVTIFDINAITLAQGVDVTFASSDVNGKTITVNGTGNNAGETFTVELPAAGATADISGLAIDTDDISGVYVLGAAGTDTITGTNGADTIIGGAGSDAITGGAGVDVMTGGNGNDVYTIDAGASTDTSATAVTDVITDFASGDTFVLGAAGDSTNYAENQTSVDSLTALLTAANTALDGTVLYYFGVTGGNGYLITDDATSAGANNIIQLTGVITFADNGAAITA